MTREPTKEDLKALQSLLDATPLICKGPHTIVEEEGVVLLKHVGREGFCVAMLKKDYDALLVYKSSE